MRSATEELEQSVEKKVQSTASDVQTWPIQEVSIGAPTSTKLHETQVAQATIGYVPS